MNKELTKKINLIIFSPTNICLGVCILVITGLFSMSLVWQRLEIKRTATHIKSIENEIVKIERNFRLANDREARAHQPSVLREAIAGKLKPTSPTQEIVLYKTSTKSAWTHASKSNKAAYSVASNNPRAQR